MERNWLIRTSQNQILGPVAKVKLLEFIQKGALGMTDEVASGNGYWFSLKEKDLVEKYLYGDIPQGYNPISESKSVLAKRENPDKTSSLNAAPVNNATQVIKLSSLGPGLAPKRQDLEFPEVSGPPLKIGVPVLDLSEDSGLKLPASDDLEFPDVNVISAQVDQSFKYPGPNGAMNANHGASSTMPVSAKAPVAKIEISSSNEEVLLPNEDDLEFPDMEEKTSTKVEKGKVDLGQQHTRTVALDEHQAALILPEIGEEKAASVEVRGSRPQRNLDSDFGEMSLTLALKSSHKEEVAPIPAAKVEKVQKVEKVEKVQHNDHPEEKKLLHERKPKSSAKPAAQRDPNREVAHKAPAEPLKKRNDNYIFFILIILILIIVAVFFYFKEILNKPLPV